MMRCPKCTYTVLDNNIKQCPACIYKADMICVDDVDETTKAKYYQDYEGFKFIFSDGYEPDNTYVPPTQKELDQLEHEMKVNQFIQEYKQEVEANKPKCPICQSTNLSKISALKKAAKVGLFGIFGAGDIGKTWKCNNCGSKF